MTTAYWDRLLGDAKVCQFCENSFTMVLLLEIGDQVIPDQRSEGLLSRGD
jgi:hypothetical protein